MAERKLEWWEWDDLHEDESHELLMRLLQILKLEVWEHKWDGVGRRKFEIRPSQPIGHHGTEHGAA